ncbi:ROK family transcriptional regulator [Evansella tamaricis]|uniref:ROK family transcriptional regulator n=1 Tax=Evansella tamaricis TaxID=2069301 RepID=A0ABS6JGG0_9BACI|nr:ROK family transcriptional regulator [Evansella tamaricis]MBU9712716.1 ROK family transcriptional regulator [Evansella tamaricis]
MIKKGGDQSFVRIHNQNLILDEIIKKKQISRADLSKSLNISAPSISSNVEPLLRSGILREWGPGKSVAGRKPIMLQFNSKYGYILGIDLSKGQIISALSDLSGIPHVITKGEKTRNVVGHDLINMIEEHIYKVLKREGMELSSILAITIASPGIMMNHRHIRIDPEQIHWQDTNPALILQERLNVPVVIENDINVAALAEYKNLKKYERTENMVFISVGRGLGSGLIIGGQLYKGSFGGAGEVALMSSSISQQHLSYYEALLSLETFKQEVAGNQPNSSPPINEEEDEQFLQRVQDLLSKGDPFVEQAVNKISRHIAVMIANVSALLNPQLVVVGGELMALSNYLFPKIKNDVYTLYPFPIEMKVSEEVEHVGLHGSLVIARDEAIRRLIK